MKQQQGFTLIELIVVIVILGILAATALPRFVDLQADARVAKAQGARAAIQSAAALAHSVQLVSNLAAGSSVTMDGQNVTMINGYPTADNLGIDLAAGGLADYSLTGGSAGAGASRAVATDAGHATCFVSYTAASGAAAPLISVAPARASCT